MESITIAGCGCGLIDYLYNNIDFASQAITRAVSRSRGDGGLLLGGVTLTEDLESFLHKDFASFRQEMVGRRDPDRANIGGPALVALINAAQLLCHHDSHVRFFGAYGDDNAGKRLFSLLQNTPLDLAYFRCKQGTTPFTLVLSDPTYHDGHGERSFVHNIGVGYDVDERMLDDEFFRSDILLFGATALVPMLHGSLLHLLKRGREKGAVNVVSTVYDFLSERKNPGSKWPLGNSDECYALTDVLVCDHEEALKLSGKDDVRNAIDFFKQQGVSSVIVTHGANHVHFYSDGSVFSEEKFTSLPVAEAIKNDLAEQSERRGDTTGCGDNFCGGVIASLAMQIGERKKNAADLRGTLDIVDAVAWGVASGGLACFYLGGTFFETHAGEKKHAVYDYYTTYKQQIAKR